MWAKLRYTVLAVLVALNGCTIVNMRYERSYIDHALEPYVNSFIYEAGMRNIELSKHHLTVILDNIDHQGEFKHTIGYCYNEYLHPTIIIDKDTFFAYDVVQREMLLFHELGHCLMHRTHCEAVSGGYSVSIMTEYIGDTANYVRMRDMYVREIFDADKQCR